MRDALSSMLVQDPPSARSTRKIQQFDESSSMRDTEDQEQSNGRIIDVDCTELTPRARKPR